MQNEARRRRRQKLADVQNDIPSPPKMSGKPLPFAMRKSRVCVCLEKELSFAPRLRQRYHLVHSTYCSPDHTYTDELMSQYNVSSCFSAPSDQAVLQDIFLSPRGLLDQEDSSIANSPRFKHLSVCGSCHHSLLTVKTDNFPRTINCQRFARKTPSQT